MTPNTGKIILRFTREQIESCDKRGRFFIVNHKNPADYSLEVGCIEAVNPLQSFFKPLDQVLVHYTVFMDGRSKLTTKPSNRIETLPNGDELYLASDGTDHNDSDVYGKFVEGKLLPLKGLVVLSPAPTVEKIGSLYIPKTADTSEKLMWRRLEAIHPEDEAELHLSAGDTVATETETTYEVCTPNDSYYMTKTRYIAMRKLVT